MSFYAGVPRIALRGFFSTLILTLAGMNAAAAWPDPAWALDTPMTIRNLGSPLSDYQVKIDLDSSFPFESANADGSDLRVTNSDGGTLLPFWIESWTGTSATIFVKIPSLPTGNTVVRLYYGNPSAPSASDASAVFDFYDPFEVPFGDRPLTNAAAPQVTPTYDGSGQVVHPGIVYFPGGWNGWEYWLVVTPYPNSDASKENPSILVSHDGAAWTVPAGLTNPIVLPGWSNLADADLFYDAASDSLWIYHIHAGSPGGTQAVREVSSDGVNWSAEQVAFTVPDYDFVSPAVGKIGSTYYIWYIKSGSAGCSSGMNSIYYRTSADGFVWSDESPVNFTQPGYAPWHIDIIPVPSKGEYWAVLSAYPQNTGCGSTVLFFAKSSDGISWTTYNRVALGAGGGGAWDRGQIYRSTLLYDGGSDLLRVWYSANDGSAWRMGYTERNYTQFLPTLSSVGGDWAASGNGTWSQSSEQARRGSYSGKVVQAGPGAGMLITKAQPDSTNFCQEWEMYDDLDASAFKVVRVKNGDQRVGMGVWTVGSSDHYAYHDKTYSYVPTSVVRTQGWHRFGIRLQSNATAVFTIDNQQVGSLTGQFATATEVSLDGFDSGTPTTTSTYYVDDVRIRKCASPEPSVSPGLPVNHPPVASSDAYLTGRDRVLTKAAPAGVLANDSDPDGDTVTALLATPPSHGMLSLSPDGSFTYTPAPGYAGPDGFTYTAYDGQVGSPTAVVTITVRASTGIQSKPDRVLVVSGIQMKDSYVIRGAADFGDIVALLKLWGVPFDILRLDTHSMTLSDFVDDTGNARYGAIIWTARQDQYSWQPQDYSVLSRAVDVYHTSLIAIANRIQEPLIQGILGLGYSGWSAMSTPVGIATTPHFISRELAGTTIAASEAFPSSSGPQVTVSGGYGVETLATAGVWPQLTARVVDTDSNTRAVWIGGDPDNVFKTSPSFIALLKRSLVWVKGYAVYKDYGKSVVLRMDDPGTAATAYLTSWNYSQLSQSLIHSSVIAPLQAHNAKLGAMFCAGYPDLATQTIVHSVTRSFTDPYGKLQDIVSTRLGLLDAMAAGVLEVQSHGLTHMVPDLSTVIPGSTNWWNGSTTIEWPEVGWYREFYDTRRGAEVSAATQGARLQQSSDWNLEDFGQRPLAFVAGGHAISGDRYEGGGTVCASGTVTATLVGAMPNSSYTIYYNAGGWLTVGSFSTNGLGNGQGVFPSSIFGSTGAYFAFNGGSGSTQYIAGPAGTLGPSFSFPVRDRTLMTPAELAQFYLAHDPLTSGTIVGQAGTCSYTPPHIAPNYTYKLAGERGYGLILDESSHYAGPDYVVSLPVCVTGTYQGNFNRGVPAVIYFHDLDIAGNPGFLAGLLSSVDSSYPGATYLSMDEWSAYMHAQLSADAAGAESLRFGFAYDAAYARYFGTHTSGWTLHLSDDILDDLRALGRINVLVDGVVASNVDAETYFAERNLLTVPAGIGSHTIEFSGCTAEICNGLDDDCDGVIDDGDPGGGATCATGRPGVCAPGTMRCAGGVVACQSNTPASAEACDGLDNDCDGSVDEALTAAMTIPMDAVGIPGQTIAVPIGLGDVTGTMTYSAEMDVGFTSNVVSVASVAQGAALDGKDCTIFENRDTPGQILIDVFCTEPLEGNAPLAEVSFVVADVSYGTTTPITFARAQLNEGCPGVMPQDGLFTVQGAEICDGQDNDGDLLVDEICTVSGVVLYYRQDAPVVEPSEKPVPRVGIRATTTGSLDTVTDDGGAYLIGGLSGVVTVTPLNKLGDRNGAISSLDAAVVAMVSVGNGQLSDNQVLAGDVTGNRTISALDASYIARSSVGLVDRFPVNASSDWKFLRCVPNYSGTCADPVYTINPIIGPQTANFYAILYGDVTGNWPVPGAVAASRAAVSLEADAITRVRVIADRNRGEGAPPALGRPAGMPPAGLSLAGWKPLRVGERAELTVDLRNADGILGLDLVLRYDSSRLAIVGVQPTGIGSALSVARGDRHGTHRIAAYGYAALSGSGSILTITVEGLKNTARQLPPTIGGTANEGGIPLRVGERGPMLPMRR